jgi:hypothetical protein
MYKAKAGRRRVAGWLQRRVDQLRGRGGGIRATLIITGGTGAKGRGIALPQRGNAARLKGNERIRARVAELQGYGAERAAVTLQGLLGEASDIQPNSFF